MTQSAIGGDRRTRRRLKRVFLSRVLYPLARVFDRYLGDGV
jgi:hypothetical protein